jgi:threonylcarbamoyladenosine tRNA methylthiotransferase MtaB
MLKNHVQPQVLTFGCRLNTYESEVIKDLSKKACLSDTVVINTCAVTKEAERQAKQTIRKIHRENPNLKILVTGCSAQIDPKQYSDMPEVTKVIGNVEKMQLATYTDHDGDRVLVQDIMQVKETAHHLVSGFEGKARAFVQIQNGCDHRCTFCTIPYGRGNSRSIAIGEIVKQIQALVDEGYQEIVFTGVDITAYGLDLPGKPSLGQMIKRVFNLVKDLKRLRLTSLDPVEVDDDFWDLVANEPRLMPHLHISLQAGDDMILKRMKRRHLRSDVIDFCKKAKSLRRDVVFGADLIAGFPTETDEMFENSLKIIDECDLTYLHIFPYSPRPNTPASKMPQLPKNIIKQRAALLREKGDLNLQKHCNSQLGMILPVLLEKEGIGKTYCKTDHFTPVIINQQLPAGDVIMVKIVKVFKDKMGGELV